MLIGDNAGAIRLGRVKPNNRPSPGPLGNTQGPILPETSPNASGAGKSAPPPRPPKAETGWWQRWGSDAVRTGLDIVGLIPVVGEVADGANAMIYLAEGDKVNAASIAASMLPLGGQAAKWGKNGVDAAQAARTAGKAGVEIAATSGREAAEAVTSKLGNEVAETAGGQARKSADNAASGGHVKKSPEELAAKMPRRSRSRKTLGGN
ncbi:MAG: hypothetical protein IPL80_01305 [Sterolibacteriaceae bacterium]|nr:hypothetical protein [Sterolibacteriaceae bacterium]